MDPCGSILVHLGQSGCVWVYLGPFGSSGAICSPFGAIWVHSGLFGSNYVILGQKGFNQVHMGLFQEFDDLLLAFISFMGWVSLSDCRWELTKRIYLG